MDIDDLEPKQPEPEQKKLEEMSIADLKDYIEEMEREIAKAKETIAKKEEARAGADSVFKT